MILTYYSNNLQGKYYEINKNQKHQVYIHYGPEPNGPMSLPWGKFEVYNFKNSDDCKKFYEKKINEKLKKKYTIESNKPTQIFKWMLKHSKAIVKNKKGGSKINMCCKSNNKTKKCIRKDGKVFSLPRRFTKKRCIKGPIKGFTMKSSCAPYKYC